jgi:hypothetical protein
MLDATIDGVRLILYNISNFNTQTLLLVETHDIFSMLDDGFVEILRDEKNTI